MFDWPPNVYTKTRVKIAQILWTLWLDFDGEIVDSDDAVKELLEAMRGHGIDIPESEVMGYRIVLPHLDGGKYGHYIRRVVLGQRTKEIRLVSDLPDESYLPDGAGGVSVDDQIDRQLFGGISIEPARGKTRDQGAPEPEPARGQTRDLTPRVTPEPARGPTRDDVMQPDESSRDVVMPPTSEPARGATRDIVTKEIQEPQPARGATRDVAGKLHPEPARGPVRDSVEPARGSRDVSADPRPRDISYPFDDIEDDPNDLDACIRRLDLDLVELSGPVVIDEPTDTRPQDLVDTIVSLMGELESTLTAGVVKVAAEGRTETDWNELLETKAALTDRLGKVIRRAKEMEQRIIDLQKEKAATVAGLEARLGALQQENARLSTNIEALLRGERAPGQHVRAAQRFLAETPSDRPEGGRNQRRRTTGSDSTLAYSVGPP